MQLIFVFVHILKCLLGIVRYLVDEKYFEKIDVFEQRSSVGGVWNYTPGVGKVNGRTVVPQVNPSGLPEEPVWHRQQGKDEQVGKGEYSIVSPVYSRLEANSLKEVMQFSDKPFPSDERLYPLHSSIRKYLDEYAEDLKHLIKLEMQVIDVRKIETAGKWSLTARSLRSGSKTTDIYDAVVVANGHYSDPYIPNIAGIKSWNEAYPGVIMHSKFYDTPESFANKKVAVIGNSASGADICIQVSEFCTGKPLLSSRTDSPFAGAVDAINFPEIVEFLSPKLHNRAIRFADGRVEENVDTVLFCTGYLYSYPFLSSLDPPATNGQRVMNLYEQLFYMYDPTLVFPVLQYKVIPFSVGANQAAVFARVWSGRLNLPSLAEMKAWEDSAVAERGISKSFHVFGYPLDVNYLNFLHDWAAKAERRPGLANNGNGRQSIRWGEREKWVRVRGFPEMKRAFGERVKQGVKVTTIKELGYDYDEWKLVHGRHGRPNL